MHCLYSIVYSLLFVFIYNCIMNNHNHTISSLNEKWNVHISLEACSSACPIYNPESPYRRINRHRDRIHQTTPCAPTPTSTSSVYSYNQQNTIMDYIIYYCSNFFYSTT
jgi:hypothetical protein